MESNSSLDQSLRSFFKYFNHFMLFMWRLGLGNYINWSPKIGGRIMVITSIGRKSGLPRRTPVNYVEVDGDIYCTAGFGHISDWYRNILSNPNVEIWLPDSWWQGEAQDVSDDPAALSLLRLVLQNSGFAAFAAGINAYKISDEELKRATPDYRLIRIQRSAPRTGKGGPGEWAWVWPGLAMLMIPFVFRKRRK